MKSLSYLHPLISVKKTKGKGRGVFALGSIAKGTIIETAPVIVMTGAERKLLDQTLLHDYIFEWGPEREQCCMALGYVPLYNHAYGSNCEYEMDFKKQLITVTCVKDVKQGEELFINYNGDADNAKPVWFETQ